MNLLGKIAVVAILVASLVFMTLAMAVYATHTNWQLAVTKPGGLQEQLETERATNARLTEEYNSKQSTLLAEQDQLRRQLAKAETELVSLEQSTAEINDQLTTLKGELSTATAAVSATQDQNMRLAQQSEELRTGIRTEQTKRDELFQIAKNATLDLQQRLGELTDIKERLSQILPQVAQYRATLTSMDLNPDLPPDFVPEVDGKIRVVRQEGAQKLIEITLGSDDGLQRGTDLVITRDGRYLGMAQIKQTWADRAVGEVISGSVLGNIQEGDRVATRDTGR